MDTTNYECPTCGCVVAAGAAREHDCVAALKAEATRLHDALAWYADKEHAKPGEHLTSTGPHYASAIERDAGARARAVLAGYV